MEEIKMQTEGAAEVAEQETAEVAEQPAPGLSSSSDEATNQVPLAGTTAEETSTEVASDEVAPTEETSTPDEITPAE